MSTRQRRIPARFLCRVGLSCLLAAAGGRPLLAQANDGTGSSAQSPQSDLASLPGGQVPDAGAACGSAGSEKAEVIPELLALADWPLDPAAAPAGGCARAPASVAAAEPLPPPVEIAGYPAVARVVAGAEEPPAAVPLPPLPEAPDPAPDMQVAVLDADSLDQVRGGFEVPDSNLRFSFGIERAVYINGELMASTVLNLKDLQGAIGGAGIPITLPATAGSAFTVIQNGAGNGVSAHIGPNLAGTIIQNTLNDQKIVNLTTINATVNSAQVMRSMALDAAIRDGVVGALRR